MAIDALSLPFDITWQRLAWSRDMLDRSYGGSLPPKWHSSLAVYIYPVPLADTVDDYPDHRIFYLKMTASVTGWSWREEIDGHIVASSGGDPWQQAGWEAIAASGSSQTYWPCVGAILQVGIYPRPEAGVADDDYPFIVDFEPKKRELYEAITDTGEVLSESKANLNTRKGSTTTNSVDVSADVGFKIGKVGVGVSGHYGWNQEQVDITTRDWSTERREVAGRTTQLAQMYQLFNGYHSGTNRAVFALFPRPHNVSPGQQIEYSLIRGDRELEGLQDVFLIVQVPRSIPGICVRGYLDTAHKSPMTVGTYCPVIVTRRSVGGCGTWQDDRLKSVPPPSGPPPRVLISGEYHVSLPPSPAVPLPNHQGGGGVPAPDHTPVHGPAQIARARRDGRIALADTLNTTQSHIRQALLANAASGAYKPVEFLDTDTFRALAGEELSRSTLPLGHLERLGRLSAAHRLDLAAHGITTVGALFAAAPKAPTVAVVRQLLLDALIRRQAGGGAAPVGQAAPR